MIRRVSLLLVVAFLMFWFTGAYVMKRKVSGFLEYAQTDNIKLVHSGLSIAGFPLSWKVRISSPKILFIDNHSSMEAELQDITLCFSYGLKETSMDLGQNFILNHVVDEKITKYHAKADNNLMLYLSTNKRIYEIDDHQNAFYEIINNAHLDKFAAYIYEIDEQMQQTEIFSIKDFAFGMQKEITQQLDNILFSLSGYYKSDSRFFDFKSSSIDTKIRYYLDDSNNEKKEYDRMIDIKKLYMDFDDAFLDSKGSIKLTRSDAPAGQFTIMMKNYDNIINIIIPHDFILSQTYVKKIISKAVLNSGIAAANAEQVKFEIKFSNEGVSIGNFNISEPTVTNE